MAVVCEYVLDSHGERTQDRPRSDVSGGGTLASPTWRTPASRSRIAFAGHTPQPLNVAQHSVYVSWVVEAGSCIHSAA